jgi:hypothetical protein
MSELQPGLMPLGPEGSLRVSGLVEPYLGGNDIDRASRRHYTQME